MLYNFGIFSCKAHLYFFLSIDTIFSNLTKNALKFFKLEKKVLNNFFLVAPNMVFGQKTIITFFLQIISLHKLDFRVCYEEVY